MQHVISICLSVALCLSTHGPWSGCCYLSFMLHVLLTSDSAVSLNTDVSSWFVMCTSTCLCLSCMKCELSVALWTLSLQVSVCYTSYGSSQPVPTFCSHCWLVDLSLYLAPFIQRNRSVRLLTHSGRLFLDIHGNTSVSYCRWRWCAVVLVSQLQVILLNFECCIYV